MRSKLYILILFVIIIAPHSSLAEHSCIDERPNGREIIIKEPLPRNWLMVGKKSLSDPQLHSVLRSKFTKNYTSGVDGEGFTIDHFCGYKDGIYITISNGDFGPYAEFSSVAQKCEKCNRVSANLEEFASGSRLILGQNKTTVSSILGYNIEVDITSISFEEIEKVEGINIAHEQTLRIEFRDNKLIRFSIFDSRERYN